tara:strand:- start:4815 stop:5069 length:255 start_codon:yes stop_codon:yes gene_type:complete
MDENKLTVKLNEDDLKRIKSPFIDQLPLFNQDDYYDTSVEVCIPNDLKEDQFVLMEKIQLIISNDIERMQWRKAIEKLCLVHST